MCLHFLHGFEGFVCVDFGDCCADIVEGVSEWVMLQWYVRVDYCRVFFGDACGVCGCCWCDDETGKQAEGYECVFEVHFEILSFAFVK